MKEAKFALSAHLKPTKWRVGEMDEEQYEKSVKNECIHTCAVGNIVLYCTILFGKNLSN